MLSHVLLLEREECPAPLCHFLYAPHKSSSGDLYAMLLGLHTQKILNIMS